MSDLENKYAYLRTEERQKSFLVAELNVRSNILFEAILKLQGELIAINDGKKIASNDLDDVRSLLNLKGLGPVAISEREMIRAQIYAEDIMHQKFYGLNSKASLTRAGEREESARRYQEERAKKGYDSDYDL